MMNTSATNVAAPQPPVAEPTWDVAHLFPAQGTWSVQEYLDLQGNRLVEFSDGIVEVLAMPTMVHQLIMMFLSDALQAFVRPQKLGTVLVSPFKIQLWETKFRQPDVMFMRAENAARMSNAFWDGADLVMEVVSEDDRRRDTETKRFEYARAGITEYWLVDPQFSRITVLRLNGRTYDIHGDFGRGELAVSSNLQGFSVPASDVFDAAL